MCELGYRVLEAPDGAAALRLLDGGVQVDMLVADVGSPGGRIGGRWWMWRTGAGPACLCCP